MSEAADIHEICCAAFGRGSRIEELIRIPNRAEDTIMRHQISPNDVDRARRVHSVRHYCLLGLLHSHILSDAVPSDGDISGYATGSLMLIYSLDTGALRAYRVTHSGKHGYREKIIKVVKTFETC